MAFFRILWHVALGPEEAWRRLTDWPRHGVHIPLTRVTVEPSGPTGVGTLLSARTGIGPVGFDDPMEVVRWAPPSEGRPGVCRLEKRGSVVTGWAVIVVGGGAGGSRVLWREEIRVAGLPRVLDAPVAWGARLVFGRLVRALLTR
ncbi:SRPBCC family protein [Nocardiopsis sp. RSe5-2]|uniref:SRPBCC family protein n=1 Tax=Nocardiopsis endophytica TaxID=3018445 RepID=A0ABT4U120_9ACTN|nr:SRPBCC family protein [Nocardiopsis endophytica]MDA2810639.1 SRPBCC family protein [Nocardiopsis endophytica]